MKKIIISLLVVTAVILTGVFTASVVVKAFSEPTASPPGNNVPAPINVGPTAQTKSGDLTVNNLTADGGITLGGVFRDMWPAGGEVGAACTWDGWKCNCVSDNSFWAGLRLMIGAQCTSGRITDASILGLDISSKNQTCWPKPATCTGGYTFRNED
ncbi:MAG: hypothetical protein ABH822_01815 [Patescibacteria group bacterium]